ncbi:TlpA family protein disulfide reductase [Niveispirillum sp. KHB5.9]|uniref:TlpA family protein disulfide reductase n=1 Tax=Niveispirillum sp. KHB5.9 TaxID=3400269 RepID=UPI003A8C426D
MAIFRRIATIVAVGTAILVTGGCGEKTENSAATAAKQAPMPLFQGEARPFVASPDRPPLPALSITDKDGQPVDLAAFKGKALLINLWATWCAPCIREMPALDRLQADMGGDRFQVLAISVDRGGLNEVGPFFEKAGIKSLPIYLDQKMTSMKAFPLKEGLPLSILVDAEGREVGRLAGAAHWDGAEAKALIGWVMR